MHIEYTCKDCGVSGTLFGDIKLMHICRVNLGLDVGKDKFKEIGKYIKPYELLLNNRPFREIRKKDFDLYINQVEVDVSFFNHRVYGTDLHTENVGILEIFPHTLNKDDSVLLKFTIITRAAIDDNVYKMPEGQTIFYFINDEDE